MVGELGTKEREIERGSKQAADREHAEPGVKRTAVAALVVRVVRGRAGHRRVPAAFIRVPSLLWFPYKSSPRGLVREHDEGRR